MKGGLDPVTDMHAVVALTMIGESNPAAIPLLMKALGDPSTGIAMAAVTGLARWGKDSPDSVMPALAEALSNGKEPLVTNVLSILRKMKERAAVVLPEVVSKYDGVDEKARIAVIHTVTEMDTTGDYAVALFEKALMDPNPLTRKEALLGSMKYRKRIDPLIHSVVQCLKDPDEENRVLSAGVLRGLGPKGASAVPYLLDMINSDNTRVRVVALSTLGSVSPRPPSPEIIMVLEKCSSDRDEKVRKASVEAMKIFGQKNPEKVLPVLEKALAAEQQENIKKSIAAAIETLKSGEAKPQSKKTPN
jgi:HEAT repeat protein